VCVGARLCVRARFRVYVFCVFVLWECMMMCVCAFSCVCVCSCACMHGLCVLLWFVVCVHLCSVCSVCLRIHACSGVCVVFCVCEVVRLLGRLFRVSLVVRLSSMACAHSLSDSLRLLACGLQYSRSHDYVFLFSGLARGRRAFG
jgi:hypothetical protein